MTRKVTMSFPDETLDEARRSAERAGVSLSAWFGEAAREKALRDVFEAHAAAVRRAGLDLEPDALADERELAMVDAALFRDEQPRA